MGSGKLQRGRRWYWREVRSRALLCKCIPQDPDGMAFIGCCRLAPLPLQHPLSAVRTKWPYWYPAPQDQLASQGPQLTVQPIRCSVSIAHIWKEQHALKEPANVPPYIKCKPYLGECSFLYATDFKAVLSQWVVSGKLEWLGKVEAALFWAVCFQSWGWIRPLSSFYVCELALY